MLLLSYYLSKHLLGLSLFLLAGVNSGDPPPGLQAHTAVGGEQGECGEGCAGEEGGTLCLGAVDPA